MKIPVFLVGAIVLIVFAIIATDKTTLAFLSVSWTSWLCASILSFLTNLLLPWGIDVGSKQQTPQ